MKKIFNHRSFYNFVLTPLVSVSSVTVFLLFVNGINNTSSIPLAKFAAGVVDIVGKFATTLIDTVAAVHLDLQIFPQIFKKFEITLTLFSGAWGKMIHEKKSRDTVPWIR
jgi:hypothetical protein